MDGHLKVAGVQVTVNQNDIFGNMANVEKMAMKVADNEKNVDLILCSFTLSLLCGPSLTSIHDYCKNHSFD